MKLWLISQKKNDNYDTYDAAVVAAETEELAVLIHPSQYPDPDFRDWAEPKYVSVEYLGEAESFLHEGVVLASFNAG